LEEQPAGTALVTSKDIMVEGILEGITMVAITLVDTMAVIMAPAISAVPMEVTKEVTTEVIMVDITEGIMVITMGSERLVPCRSKLPARTLSSISLLTNWKRGRLSWEVLAASEDMVVLEVTDWEVSEVTDWDTGSEATEDTVVMVDMALADMALDMAMAVLVIMGRGRQMTMIIS